MGMIIPISSIDGSDWRGRTFRLSLCGELLTIGSNTGKQIFMYPRCISLHAFKDLTPRTIRSCLNSRIVDRVISPLLNTITLTESGELTMYSKSLDILSSISLPLLKFEGYPEETISLALKGDMLAVLSRTFYRNRRLRLFLLNIGHREDAFELKNVHLIYDPSRESELQGFTFFNSNNKRTFVGGIENRGEDSFVAWEICKWQIVGNSVQKGYKHGSGYEAQESPHNSGVWSLDSRGGLRKSELF